MRNDSDDEIRKGVVSFMRGTVILDEYDKLYDEGVEKGIEQNSLDSIRSLMNNLKISANEAMNYLDIPKEKQEVYLEKL